MAEECLHTAVHTLHPHTLHSSLFHPYLFSFHCFPVSPSDQTTSGYWVSPPPLLHGSFLRHRQIATPSIVHFHSGDITSNSFITDLFCLDPRPLTFISYHCYSCCQKICIFFKSIIEKCYFWLRKTYARLCIWLNLVTEGQHAQEFFREHLSLFSGVEQQVTFFLFPVMMMVLSRQTSSSHQQL